MGRRAKGGGLPTLKPDGNTGQYYRELGWKEKADGTYRQHKFFLGKDRAEAMVRYLKLDQVWTGVEKHWAREGRLTPRAVWDEITLQIGKSVARGEIVCRLDLPEWATARFTSEDGNSIGNDSESLVFWIRCLQEDFPNVRLELANTQVQEEGDAVLQREAEDHLDAYKRLRKRNTSQRLHAALDAFGVYQVTRQTDNAGTVSATGQVYKKEIPLLKEHVADACLCDVDSPFIERWLQFWAKRPVTKRGDVAAITTCQNMIKRVKAFLRWLHREPSWEFRLVDVAFPTMKVKPTQKENAARANGNHIDTYTDAELCLLYKYALPRERLYMLLALNCGFGCAEIASLQDSEIHLDTIHKQYKTPGSFIIRIRGKTGVFAEWKLWDETVDAIKAYRASRPKPNKGTTTLLVNTEGESFTTQTSGGNRAQHIPNKWVHLTKRVRKEDAAFRSLSFNKLRKTAAQMCEEVSSSGETAGYFLAHGKPVSSDAILDAYRNRDFRRVHLACVQMRERLQPMIDAGNEPVVKRKRTRTKKGQLAAPKATVREEEE